MVFALAQALDGLGLIQLQFVGYRFSSCFEVNKNFISGFGQHSQTLNSILAFGHLLLMSKHPHASGVVLLSLYCCTKI